MRTSGQSGFSLVEMIMVIVIVGILGSMVAVFVKLPVQQYFDIGRRADLTDIADLALKRIESDIRSALPHSARATSATCPGGAGTCSFLEFLPSSGSGRYRAAVSGVTNTDILDFTAADSSFEVLGAMPTFAAGDQVIVTDNTVAAAYGATYRTPWVSTVASIVTITSIQFPSVSPSAHFYIVNQAVSHVCDPSGGTLMRYSYAIQAAQPTTAAALGTGRLLANNVASCSFDVTQSNSLVAISLVVSKKDETRNLSDAATLYKVVHVGNGP